MTLIRVLACCLALLVFAPGLAADFREEFDSATLALDPAAREGWAWKSGDGKVDMTLSQAEGLGLLEVDSSADRRNIWWALIRRSVNPHIDAAALTRPDRELRVEAKVRASEAPRRVNLHFNHSRTTDFHSHLMEYDIPDTENWHVISMTTRGFDSRMEDEVFVQLAMMDWGLGSYRLEIDYLRVSLVDPEEVGADFGSPIPYRPSLPPVESFSHVMPAAQAAMVDSAWPALNFGTWSNAENQPLVSVGGTKLALLRFDPANFQGAEPDGWGLLELTTEQVHRPDTPLKDFGLLRVVEVLDGDMNWRRDAVTWESFLAGKEVDDVINGQMMIDIEANPEPGGHTLIPVSPPVLQRLLSGRTRGLAIRPLGAIEAAFRIRDNSTGEGPNLYFNATAPIDAAQENQP